MACSSLGDQCHPHATQRHDTMEEAHWETQMLQGHVRSSVRADHEAGGGPGPGGSAGRGVWSAGFSPLLGSASPDSVPLLGATPLWSAATTWSGTMTGSRAHILAVQEPQKWPAQGVRCPLHCCIRLFGQALEVSTPRQSPTASCH